MVDVVQLVRASDCGSECRGFESHPPPSKGKRKFNNYWTSAFFMSINQTLNRGDKQLLLLTLYRDSITNDNYGLVVCNWF